MSLAYSYRDPYRFGQSYDRAFMRGMPPAGPQQPDFPELPPEQADTLKQKLLNVTQSGLHYLGGTLNKAFGGRAIRAGINAALFGGPARDIASVIPFSDTLGITDPSQEVTGQELLNKAGFHPERGNWAERHLAGPALEIALDPGTYLSFGAKNAATALGRAMQAGGHVPGWTHEALMKGFQATAPELRAAGHGTEAIAEMARRGMRIASDEAVAAARAAGHTGSLVDQPLSRLAGVGLPFRQPIATFGEGPLSQAVARGFEAARQTAKAAPVVKELRALLVPAAGRQTHVGAAQAFETGMVPTREAVEAATRYGEHSLRSRFDDVMKQAGSVPGFEPEAMKVIRGMAEEVPQFKTATRAALDLARRHAANVAPGVVDPNAVSAAITTHFPTLKSLADDVAAHGKDIFNQAKQQGLVQADLGDDWINYVMRRYIGATPAFQGTDEARFLSTTSGSNLHRSARLKDIPGGTEQLNEFAMDPRLVGPKAMQNPGDIINHVAQEMERVSIMDTPGAVLSAVGQSPYQQKAADVYQWLKSVPHGHVTGNVPIPYFSPDVIGDVTSRGLRHARVMGASDALYAGIKGMARPISEFPNPADRVDLNEFLKEHVRLDKGLNFQRPLAAEHLRQIQNVGFPDRAYAEAVGEVAQHLPPGAPLPAGFQLPAGMQPGDIAAFHSLPQGLQKRLTMADLHAPSVHAHMALAGKPGISPIADVFDDVANPLAELGNYALHRRDAAALSGMLNSWITPSEMKPFFGWMRSYQNFFKNMVYPMAPASHTRNAITALYNNFLHGTNIGDYADAVRIQRGLPIADPGRYAQVAHLKPADAAQELARLAYAHGKVGGGITSMAERVGGRGIEDEVLQQGLLGTRRLTPYAPLAAPHATAREVFSQPGAWNVLHQAGVGGGPLHQAINRIFRGGAEALPYAEDRFAPLRIGRAVGTSIEDNARLANYLGNLRQGMAPANSGLLTRAIHFDYQDLAEAEKQALKNVVPFYTFLRKNLPYQLQMAFERPSAVSPVLHAMGATSQNDWVPEYLASGAAIPVGPEGEGQQRYLASLGLPMEEAFSRLKFRNVDVPGLGTYNLPAVGEMAMNLAGQMNPLLKAPAEWLTGRQFFSGRRLADLDTHGPASLWGQIPEEYARPLAQILANSPLARATTIARTWTDPRKSWSDAAINTLTGFRFSDVDIAKQRAIAARKELEGALAVDPHLASFTNYFPRRDQVGPLPPELVEKLRLFTLMKNEARAYAAARERASSGPGS